MTEHLQGYYRFFFFLFKFPSFSHSLTFLWAQLFILCFLVGARGKESACQCRTCKRHRFDPWMGKTLWSRKWRYTPVFLPGKSMNRGSWWAMVYAVTNTWHDCAAAHVFHTVTMKLQFPSLKLLKAHFFHSIFWEIEFKQKEAEQECTREISF